MSRREARAARAAGVTVDGLGVPPELVAGWMHPSFDAPTAHERALLYSQAAREFAEGHSLLTKHGWPDWSALERLGIRQVKALERARLAGMIR